MSIRSGKVPHEPGLSFSFVGGFGRWAGAYKAVLPLPVGEQKLHLPGSLEEAPTVPELTGKSNPELTVFIFEICNYFA